MELLTKLKEGLQVLVLGLGITFIALGLLIVAIELINKLVKGNGNKSKVAKEEMPSQIAKPAEPTVDVDETSQDNDELVAVISAAIVAALGDGHQPFKIKKIRQIPANTPKWNQAGRREQLSNR